MGLLKLMPFKVAVPKPKRNRTSEGIKRISNKIVKGKVFQDEDKTYKIAINMNNDTVNPDLRVLEFTERSYDLKDKIDVFSRTTDKKGRYTRFVRNVMDAKFFPGLPEQYVPFAPNWIVKGYIVTDNNVRKFDFKGLVGIEGYDVYIASQDD